MGRAVTRVAAEASDLTIAVAIGRGDALGVDIGTLAGVGPLGVTVTDQLVLEGCDAAIDFTLPAATRDVARACRAGEVPLVSGVTGLDAAGQASLDELSEAVPVVWAPNMSVGVTLLFHLASEAARLAGEPYDAEIVEMHHRHKVDAPSGTAVRLGEVVARAKGLDPAAAVVHGRSGAVGARPDTEVGVLALRGGGVIGEHTLVLASAADRLELTHRAQDRSVFARGAVRAARWVVDRPPARYGMGDVLGL